MNPVSQKEIKELTGLSKQFISRECKNGKLTMCSHNGKKMVDLDGHLTMEWIRRHPPKGTKTQEETKIPIEEKINYDFLKDQDFPLDVQSTGESSNLKDTKLKEQIEEIRIKNQQKRGDLIQKKIVKKVFDRIYSIDQNQFKNMGVNVSPKISAVYNESNTEKTAKILEYFLDNPEPEKLEVIKILNSGEPQRINDMNQILEDTTGAILKAVQREITKFVDSLEQDAK